MTKSTKAAGSADLVTIIPFADEAASTSVGDLTVENRLDRASLYGSPDLTRERQGLEDARRLQRLLEAIVKVLEGEENTSPRRTQADQT
ncbi:hypothetical protein [Pseudoroseomonas ludipueritiae]|uniref:Uncharacterized protein n=1 Tax=Pseudoroseomonas ludipueritiae TaxID=198093 RepID=A0ABR7R9P0_9PROT|nr:hypothetical protein [Pseudoroseomonas ludipueritiae]MBC9178526.1 hypothetical protein [Pseudoroseomonas ludipueritiae]MCG7364519.1 hypothetical protein [Roseomonas sp. ACRSG]